MSAKYSVPAQKRGHFAASVGLVSSFADYKKVSHLLEVENSNSKIPSLPFLVKFGLENFQYGTVTLA